MSGSLADAAEARAPTLGSSGRFWCGLKGRARSLLELRRYLAGSYGEEAPEASRPFPSRGCLERRHPARRRGNVGPLGVTGFGDAVKRKPRLGVAVGGVSSLSRRPSDSGALPPLR